MKRYACFVREFTASLKGPGSESTLIGNSGLALWCFGFFFLLLTDSVHTRTRTVLSWNWNHRQPGPPQPAKVATSFPCPVMMSGGEKGWGLELDCYYGLNDSI